jgi:hypothetical protein
MNIQKIINQANLIVANHHGSDDGCGGTEAATLKVEVMMAAGFSRRELRDPEKWFDYIESDDVPEALREALTALDDALDSHKSTRYVL